MLEREYKYFDDHKSELKARFLKPFLVIVGEEVVGSYDSHTEALRETLKTHALGTFLIQSTSDDPVIFRSRVYG